MAHYSDEELSMGAGFGDPRRCGRHGIATSDPSGMFDAPCPACEGEMAEEAAEAEQAAYYAQPIEVRLPDLLGSAGMRWRLPSICPVIPSVDLSDIPF